MDSRAHLITPLRWGVFALSGYPWNPDCVQLILVALMPSVYETGGIDVSEASDTLFLLRLKFHFALRRFR